MNRKDVRLGNYVYITNSKVNRAIRIVDMDLLIDWDMNYPEPIELTDDILLRLGFSKKRNENYINKYEYSLLLNPDSDIEDTIEYNGIGGTCYHETNKLFLTVFCNGHYAGKSVEFLHEFQNHWFALKKEEFDIDLHRLINK